MGETLIALNSNVYSRLKSEYDDVTSTVKDDQIIRSINKSLCVIRSTFNENRDLLQNKNLVSNG